MLKTILILMSASMLLGQDELHLESTAKGIPKMDIAIVPFEAGENVGIQKLSSNPWDVIAQDLTFSGRFNVTQTDQVDTAFFRTKNISVFVSGKYTQTGQKIQLECFLYDAYSLSLIVGKQYKASQKSLRRAAHIFSDELVYRLYGEKGIASTRIVCTAKRGKAREIVVLDYDGHHSMPITKNNRLNLTPAWSPDNRSVVYTSYRDRTPALYKTEIYTGKTKRLTANSRLNFSPSWNGIEDRIVFAFVAHGNCEVYITDSDGADMKRLTFWPSIEASPCFSPNGYEIAFTSDKTGNPHIYVMDNEGTNIRRLTFEGKYNDSPAWSPKGDKVAYISMDQGKFNIYTIDIDGENIKQLTDKTGNNEHPAFSPDGRLIVFSSTRDGGSDLYLMHADGQEQTRITFRGNLSSPEWSGY